MDYDDQKYLEASNRLITAIEDGVEGLREAGLNDAEIVAEIKNGIANAQIDMEAS